MKYSYNYLWDKGPVYVQNEDSIAVYQLLINQKEFIFAICCDGVGSLYHGEIISGIVTNKLSAFLLSEGIVYIQNNKIHMLKRRLIREIEDINNELIDISHKEGHVWGTTLSLLIIYDRHLIIYSVGDSVICSITSKGIKRLTDIDMQHNELTKVIGITTLDHKRIIHRRIKNNEKGFIVATDGLFKKMTLSLSNSFINVKLLDDKLLEEICYRLRQKGEKDNISCVCIKRNNIWIR